MKKLFSLVLALIFVFALAVPAFADGATAQISCYNEDSDTWTNVDVLLGSVRQFIETENKKGVDHCTVDLRGNTVYLDKQIYLSNGEFTLTISNGTISGSQGNDGEGCRFLWVNDAETEVAMKNLTIIGCKPDDEDDGAAMYINDDSCYIHGDKKNPGSVVFSENGDKKHTDCAGAIYASCWSDDTVIESITFTMNTCDDDGGAILSNGDGNEVVNCVFNQNVAGDVGGAIYAWDGMEIIGCTFDANNKSEYGEGHDIYCSAGDVKLVNNTFASSEKNRVYGAMQNVGTGSFLSDGSLFEVVLLAIIAIGVVAIYVSTKKKNSAN